MRPLSWRVVLLEDFALAEEVVHVVLLEQADILRAVDRSTKRNNSCWSQLCRCHANRYPYSLGLLHSAGNAAKFPWVLV